MTCEQIIDEKIRLGYDGAILTNHCQPWYYPAEELNCSAADLERGDIAAYLRRGRVTVFQGGEGRTFQKGIFVEK